MQTMTWIKATAAVGAAAIIVLQWQQHSAQAQHLKQLEEQAAQQTEVNRAQKAELDQMKQQNASFAKSMEAMAREVAKARASASVARALPPPAAPAGAPTGLKANMLTEMMKDPDMLKAMREQQAMMVKMQYGPLVKQLNLSPEQADQFYKLLTDGTMRTVESGSSLLSGGNTADAAKSVADQQKETDSAMQALLGDAGYATYKDYQQTVGDRTLLSTMKNNFVDNPLTDAQQQQLLQAMTSSRQNVQGANPPDPSQLSSPDKLAMAGQYLQQQEQINEQVLAQAEAFLSPDQIQTLGASQSNIMSMQKVGMAMAQKMLGGATNAPGGP